jgi:hypothetical protein
VLSPMSPKVAIAAWRKDPVVVVSRSVVLCAPGSVCPRGGLEPPHTVWDYLKGVPLSASSAKSLVRASWRDELCPERQISLPRRAIRWVTRYRAMPRALSARPKAMTVPRA